MATAADYLVIARDNAAQRLSEMDTVPLDTRARMTYTSKTGQTMDWNSYRRALIDELKELNALIQQMGGPFEVWVA
mgnify:CR=1 FL=1